VDHFWHDVSPASKGNNPDELRTRFAARFAVSSMARPGIDHTFFNQWMRHR
jgi:hypothetical protein